MTEAMYVKEENKVVLNTISLMWITIAALIFLLGFTYVDENQLLALKSLGAAVIGVVGIVMIGITVGIKWDRRISTAEMNVTIFLIGIACFGTLLVNAVTHEYAKFETTPMPRSLFSILIGTMEEIVFRGWLQTWLLAFTGSLFIAVVFSSGIFAVFHGAVYGLDPTAVLVVFGASLILGFVYEIGRKQLHITQSAHGIINLLAFTFGKG